MRRPVMAGNWKMYKTQAEARALFRGVQAAGCERHALRDRRSRRRSRRLAAAVEAARAQRSRSPRRTCIGRNEGAFTGEVSARMLVEVGCRRVIIAHSERRQFFGETDETAGRKVKAALAAGLTPIFCVGELLAEREAQSDATRCWNGNFAAAWRVDQCGVLTYHHCLRAGLGDWHGPHGDAGNCGRRAPVSCGSLRRSLFGRERAAELRILYGGSVKPDNVKGLMAQAEIDGALVGGASLDPQQFASIVNF